MPTEQGIRIAAPAKINLALAVGARRANGRHQIEAPSVPIDLCDEIEATAAAAISSRLIGMETPAGELAGQAVAALAAAAGIRRGVHLLIKKRIPAGAGLGGASSDAAAALIAASRLWGLNWPPAQLAALAAPIGSDIAFFIGCRPALIAGGGERIEPLAHSPSGWCVLVLPPLFCSTEAVYARHARDASAKIARRRRGGGNDLLPAALAVAPELAGLMAAAAAVAGRKPQLTGSGSGFFFLAADSGSAAALAARLAARLACRVETALLLARRPGPSLCLGSSQVVRQRILAPPFAGSNPASPA